MAIKQMELSAEATSVEQLPPRKKAVVKEIMDTLRAEGIEVNFDSTFEGSVTLYYGKEKPNVFTGVPKGQKTYTIIELAKILRSRFTFHGAAHGSKGFKLFHFSVNGRSPFNIHGWDRAGDFTIGSPSTFWTPKGADLPEYSVLALRQNLEALTGVKLKPMVAKAGELTLKGTINGAHGGSKEQVLEALKGAGVPKTLQVRVTRMAYNPRRGNVRQAVKNADGSYVTREKVYIYIKKAEAAAHVDVVGGPASGYYELIIS